MVIVWLLLTAFEFLLPVGRSGGMGAGVAVVDWKHSLVLNPGIIGYGPKFGGAVAYTVPYGIRELHSGMVGICFPVSRIDVGAGSFMTGTGSYQEWNMSLVLGGRVLNELSAGIGVHGCLQHMGGYVFDLVPVVDLGLLWKSNRWSAGIAGQRLNSPRFRNGDELAPKFKAGVCWEPVSTLVLAVDIERIDDAERAIAGVEFKLFPQIAVRCGYQTSPQCFRGGIGINWAGLSLDYGYQYHHQLGDTHIFSISFRWG